MSFFSETEEKEMVAGAKIRHKLLLYYTLLFTLSLIVAFAAVYVIIRDSLRRNIESELQNTSITLSHLVETAATASIKNYLRGVAEKNQEIVASFYQEARQGGISEDEAKRRATAVLLSQTVGQSGYLYCLNSKGEVVLHPQAPLVGSNVSDFAFIKQLVVRKAGYLEYDWRNPGENAARPKAIYVCYFEPWDWLIAVSTYREEFIGLVNVDDLKASISSLKFGKTGYVFIINGQGKAIIHPKLEGQNIRSIDGLVNEPLAYMMNRKTGQFSYPWQNPGEKEPRMKFCIFNYIEDYDWIVAAASYQDEFYGPLRTSSKLVFAVFVGTIILMLTLTYKISDSITTPLQKLMAHFETASKGDFSLRMVATSNDEIGRLTRYFNRFMEQLEQYSASLKQEISVRRDAERDLRESEQRYRLVMESAADPIVIYDTEGQVSYFNPAFQRVFGWSLDECLGRKMDHFVPEENWPETAEMIAVIRSGGILPATETRRYTSSGAVRHVSISGAALIDHKRRLTGSVVILRDTTETRRLGKQLMDIGDQVRQNIGQNLHDDLCPHLIGIGGLVSALQSTIERNGGEGAELAGKIVTLIGDATAKARGLARGLCPVHLVSYGLHSALNEIAEHTRLTTDIDCSFAGADPRVISDNTLATHFYYIAQEAVNNSVKHSGASRITITLKRLGDYLHLWVVDNGRGLEQNDRTGDKTNGDGSGGSGGSHGSRNSRGIGLQIMKHRALVIGAQLELLSAPGEGTSIHVYVKPPEFSEQPEQHKQLQSVQEES